MIPLPPKLESRPMGTTLIAGLTHSTVIADFDFETYSSAGFVWEGEAQSWGCLPGANRKGLSIVGAARYAEHPDTEVLCLAFDLKRGQGRQLWRAGDPIDILKPLFDHIRHGFLLEAWNVGFEYWIWKKVCEKKMGWPYLHPGQLRCAMAKARAFALPGKLDAAGKVLNIEHKKLADGDRLLKKFSVPRNPTKTNPKIRILPAEGDSDSNKLWDYNLRDIMAESEISSRVPDLNETELEFWQYDQAINVRGVQIDLEGVHACIAVIEQAHEKYNKELQIITGIPTLKASEVQQVRKYLASEGLELLALDEENVDAALKHPNLSPNAKRVLEIRQTIGAASVKKVYAMANQVTEAGRLHDLFVYHSARTGRAAGAGPQPQNLPNHGPSILLCSACKKYFNFGASECPWCGGVFTNVNHLQATPVEWNAGAVEDALTVIKTKSLQCVEYHFGNAIAAVSGCLRGLFIAAPGKILICSDYSSIEAVDLAALAGEQWRLDVFKTHGKIYEMSASKITGIPFEEFEQHKRTTGQHHPMRKKVGKVAELASGYQGWVGSWKQFGADEFFSDEEIKQAILAWRKASPAIVEFWGDQYREDENGRRYPELFGIEGMVIQALQMPGTETEYRGIKFLVRNDVLYCRLLSGRYIAYHRPRLSKSLRWYKDFDISYEGWNTNPKNGPIGWIRMNTWGGRLTENIVQATARDILAHAIVNLEKAGYPVVLHIHDEIVCEVPEDFGTIEEFEKIMSTLPAWAQGWPIIAKGGWRGKRYRKD